jgi:hypothetical protein
MSQAEADPRYKHQQQMLSLFLNIRFPSACLLPAASALISGNMFSFPFAISQKTVPSLDRVVFIEQSIRFRSALFRFIGRESRASSNRSNVSAPPSAMYDSWYHPSRAYIFFTLGTASSNPHFDRATSHPQPNAPRALLQSPIKHLSFQLPKIPTGRLRFTCNSNR